MEPGTSLTESSLVCPDPKPLLNVCRRAVPPASSGVTFSFRPVVGPHPQWPSPAMQRGCPLGEHVRSSHRHEDVASEESCRSHLGPQLYQTVIIRGRLE